jgi:hypothetical protein
MVLLADMTILHNFRLEKFKQKPFIHKHGAQILSTNIDSPFKCTYNE